MLRLDVASRFCVSAMAIFGHPAMGNQETETRQRNIPWHYGDKGPGKGGMGRYSMNQPMQVYSNESATSQSNKSKLKQYLYFCSGITIIQTYMSQEMTDNLNIKLEISD